MNVIEGEIENVTVRGSLSLVHVKAGEIRLSAIVIDTPDTVTYLKHGNAINVIFKETEVILAKGVEPQISLQNRLSGSVKTMEKGELLSKVVLNTEVGEITSIITTNAVNQLELQTGSEVTAMIKTNEMMLSE